MRKLRYGSHCRIATNRTTGEKHIVVTINMDTLQASLREGVDALGSDTFRFTEKCTRVSSGLLSIKTVPVTKELADEMFRQYVSSHEGVTDGTHIVKISKKYGTMSVVKDDSYVSPSDCICENCGSKMVVRRNRLGNPFIGCTAFRTTGCRGTRRYEDPSSFSPGR